LTSAPASMSSWTAIKLLCQSTTWRGVSPSWPRLSMTTEALPPSVGNITIEHEASIAPKRSFSTGFFCIKSPFVVQTQRRAALIR
jgi:hypothetical protein